MHYVGKSICQFILYYASATHKHMHTRILRPFENSEPTGPKVDIATSPAAARPLHSLMVSVSVFQSSTKIEGNTMAAGTARVETVQ